MIFKEEQNVLFCQKKNKKKSSIYKSKTQISRRGDEPSILFRIKRRGGQRFFNESGRWIIITW